MKALLDNVHLVDGILPSSPAMESFLDLIIDCILRVTSDTIPQVKPRRHLKPFWNKDLTHVSRMERTIRDEWLQAGKPRDVTCDITRKYKDAKRAFRVASFLYGPALFLVSSKQDTNVS